MAKSIADIDKQIANLQEERKTLLDKDREEKLIEAKALIATYGFNEFDLGLKKKPVKHRIKYINPENPSETWVGRGKQPAWIKTYLLMGGKLEDIEKDKPKK